MLWVMAGDQPSTAAELRSNKFNQFVFASPALLFLFLMPRRRTTAQPSFIKSIIFLFVESNKMGWWKRSLVELTEAETYNPSRRN